MQILLVFPRLGFGQLISTLLAFPISTLSKIGYSLTYLSTKWGRFLTGVMAKKFWASINRLLEIFEEIRVGGQSEKGELVFLFNADAWVRFLRDQFWRGDFFT